LLSIQYSVFVHTQINLTVNDCFQRIHGEQKQLSKKDKDKKSDANERKRKRSLNDKQTNEHKPKRSLKRQTNERKKEREKAL
jgi:hypothetical protein